jgi:hypothetical protein
MGQMDLKAVSSSPAVGDFLVAEDQAEDGTVNRWSRTYPAFTNFATVTVTLLL